MCLWRRRSVQFQLNLIMSDLLITIICSCFLVASPATAGCSSLENHCDIVPFTSSFNEIKQRICSPPTKEIVTSPPPQFVVEPSNQIADSETDEALFECSVTSSDNGVIWNILWEHNNEEISSSEDFHITSNATSSVLRVLRVGVSTEGAYRCIVTNQKKEYTITSRYGYLEIHRCSGWIDTVLPPTHSTDNAVNISITKGGSTVLECLPNTTLTSQRTYVWLRDNNPSLDHTHTELPNGGLLIRDFDPSSADGVANYRCIITSGSCPQLTRDFFLRTRGGKPTTVAPSNQTTVEGTSVSFYCITNTKSTITWLRDGSTLAGRSWEVFGSKNEVLVLDNVTMETGGMYSCVDDSGITMTGLLSVLASPSSADIQVIDHTPHQDIVVLPLLSDKDYSVHLTCTTDSLSGGTEMSFTWFFGGTPIAVTPPVGVVYSVDGPSLTVTGRDVFGSYQCEAGNSAGHAVATLYLYEGTSSMEDGAKPEPPSSVSLSLDRNTATHRLPEMYLYTFRINPPPAGTFDPSLGYAVEMIVYKTGDSSYRNCSCTCDNIGSDGVGVVHFLANEYIGSRLFFRAAALDSNGRTSDFVPHYSNSEDSVCDGTVVEQVAPPPPTQLLWVPSLQEGEWRVQLSWTTPKEEQYPSNQYLTSLSIECEGRDREEPLKKSGNSIVSHSLSLPCCTACNWTVTFTTDDGALHSSVTQQNKTQAIAPTRSPMLNSVRRTNSDGLTLEIDFTLPPKNISCQATQYSVLYSGQDTFSSAYPLSSCTPVQLPGTETARRYKCIVTLNRERCWQSLNVSMTFGNQRGWSGPSHPLSVATVSQDDLITGFSGLTVTDITNSTLTLSLQVANGLDCLLTYDHSTDARLCIDPPPFSQPSCQEIPPSNPNPTITFNGLRGDTEYTVTAVMRVAGVGNQTWTTQGTTRVGSPTTPPRNLTVSPVNGSLLVSWTRPSRESSNGDIAFYKLRIVNNASGEQQAGGNVMVTQYSWKHYLPNETYTVYVQACTSAGCGPEAESSLESGHSSSSQNSQLVVEIVVATVPLPVVVVGGITVCLVCCCVVKRCRKKKKADCENNNRRTHLHTKGDEKLGDDDLVSWRGADGTAESIHSEHTSLDKFPPTESMDPMTRVKKYLETVNDQDLDELSNPSGENMESLVLTVEAEVHPSESVRVVDSGKTAEDQVRSKTNHKRKDGRSHRKGRSRRKERNEETEALLGRDSSEASLSPRKKDWKEQHLQSSPIDVSLLAQCQQQPSEHDLISLHSLGSKTMDRILSTSGFIAREREDSVASTSMNTPSQEGRAQTLAAPLTDSSSGYVVDDSAKVTEHPMPSRGYVTANDSWARAGATPTQLCVDTNVALSGERGHCPGFACSQIASFNYGSSNGYVSLSTHHTPASSSPSASKFTLELPDEFSVDSAKVTEHPMSSRGYITTDNFVENILEPLTRAEAVPDPLCVSLDRTLSGENEQLERSPVDAYSLTASLDNSSSHGGYVSLSNQYTPTPSNPSASDFTAELPDELSQESSVFDDALPYDDSPVASSDHTPRRRPVTSSGVYSASSDVRTDCVGASDHPGYVEESQFKPGLCDYRAKYSRSSSEGYMSALVTPNDQQDKHFTLPDLRTTGLLPTSAPSELGDSSTSVHFLPPAPSSPSLNSLHESPTPSAVYGHEEELSSSLGPPLTPPPPLRAAGTGSVLTQRIDDHRLDSMAYYNTRDVRLSAVNVPLDADDLARSLAQC